jgi:CRISPR-associated endonuclease/helicase Cas3
MLFSCLVDADFLDTEAFFDSTQTNKRGVFAPIGNLTPMFEKFMADKQAAASDTPVNQLRREVFRQCIHKAALPPGFFSLTVPTGGGKTLSSMAFAINHARAHDKRRIIYVIPYTSIIEQTADQFRQIFADDVVEHHSNVAQQDKDEENDRLRLAAENWDAPIIVTTSVQFFESLFASRTSRCRKLHNVANSIVILDEAQLLPPDFLNPILEALKELQKNYGVTVVFCTATQPALGPHQSTGFDFKGVPGIVEIMDDPAGLHASLKRTTIHTLSDLAPVSWDELAEEVKGQFICQRSCAGHTGRRSSLRSRRGCVTENRLASSAHNW